MNKQTSAKLNVSMPVQQLEFIDRYRGDIGDRSKVIQKALRLLQQLEESGNSDLQMADQSKSDGKAKIVDAVNKLKKRTSKKK